MQKTGIDPQQTLVLRHRPQEPQLNKVLPWLAAERPNVFNAYQQTQGEKLEKAMSGAAYVGSFIGDQPGRAIFVGIYRIGESKRLTCEEYWRVPEYAEMKESFAMKGFTEDAGRSSCLWFDLKLMDFFASWKGRLVIEWPPPELSWWRRAHRNDFPVHSILEESALVPSKPKWGEIVLEWSALNALPMSWEAALAEWRGVYYIFDMSDGKGYVGSAYGEENILGRWLNYARSGHGGNVQLRKRDPQNFRFSILERVSPDLDQGEVTRLETLWKLRLHTQTHGLNDN